MKTGPAVAIMTGASRGIGRATARALHGHGATVGLVGPSGELDELAQELGSRAGIATSDVVDCDQIEAAIAQLTATSGPADILVNNAGIGSYASMLEEAPDTYLAAEMHPFGVAVWLVNPGPADTDFAKARGVPFQRCFPPSGSPERVASLVVRAVEYDKFEQTVPRWLRSGSIARAIAPNLYRRGSFRNSAKYAASQVHRMEERTK